MTCVCIYRQKHYLTEQSCASQVVLEGRKIFLHSKNDPAYFSAKYILIQILLTCHAQQ